MNITDKQIEEVGEDYSNGHGLDDWEVNGDVVTFYFNNELDGPTYMEITLTEIQEELNEWAEAERVQATRYSSGLGYKEFDLQVQSGDTIIFHNYYYGALMGKPISGKVVKKGRNDQGFYTVWCESVDGVEFIIGENYTRYVELS